MSKKDNRYFCDCCEKKIKRNDLIFEFEFKHFCESCFMHYVKVKKAIGSDWQCRTFVDVGNVMNVCDGEEIPY